MPTKATASEDSVSATGNDYLDTLILGDKWNKDHAVTFYFDNGNSAQDVWLEQAKDAVRSVLNTYEHYIDLQFSEVNSAANANFVLRMDTLEQMGGATAIFDFPSEDDDQAIGQFPSDWSRWTPWHLQQGGYAYEAILHEVGHGLGLVHPHSSSGLSGQPFPGVDADNDPGTNGQNSAIYTVMSYLDKGESWAPQNPPNSNYGWGFPATPMAFDIAALQHIYGANTTYHSGNSTYTLPGVEGDGTFWSAIWDTGGTDVMRYTGSEDATIDLRAAPLTGQYAGGYLSNVAGIAGGFTIANGVVIENAEGGSGNDTINGNGAANHIEGNNGDDVINALGGNDTVEGGAGNDTIDGGSGNNDLDGGSGSDTVHGGNNNDLIEGGSGDDFLYGLNGDDVLHGGSGNDTLNGGIGVDTANYASATGWVHVDLEIIGPQATGTAEDTDALISIEDVVGSNGFADELRGNNVSNRLYGLGGNDTLEGRDGNDILDGGMGSDTASYESASSAVSVDLNNALPQNTLGAGIDSFISIENLTGSAFADILIGDFQNNALQGLDGNDWLFGGAGNDSINGGAGDDLLSGGEGNDNLVGSAGNDIVTYLTAAAGITVSLSIGGYQNTIGAGNDQLMGVENLQGSNFNDTLTGSQLDNVLWGVDGNDVLEGGAGNDLVYGGAGNDTLSGGDGNDTLYGGNGGDNLFGNDGNDALFGDIGNDVLDGGAGNDVMAGGTGDDIYVVGNGDDMVMEDPNSGNDTVLSNWSYTLPSTVENLTLVAGAGPINGTGNSGGNVIIGNESDNVLSGRGGLDTLSGGLGDDTFVFDTPVAPKNLVTITDFNDANDTFVLDHAIFTELTPGGFIAPNQFHIGPAAAELANRIIYDQPTGRLFYDADGDLSGAKVQFAQVIPGISLSNLDFLVV